MQTWIPAMIAAMFIHCAVSVRLPAFASCDRMGFTGRGCRFSVQSASLCPTKLAVARTNRMCQSGYEPVVVRRPGGQDGIQIVHPSWKGQVDGNINTLRLASSLGWGDGHHPTTYLCLEFLAECIQEGGKQKVLDYGTGSGVLAMTAMKFGAENVIGIDIDDEALDAALENLEMNGLREEQVLLRHTREVVQDLNGIILRDDVRGKTLQFDVVVANILIGPLMKLAPILSMSVKEDTGILCLCGLREEHIKDLETAYQKFGVVIQSVKTMEHTRWREGAEGEGTWARVTATRRKLTSEERSANLAWWNDQAVS